MSSGATKFTNALKRVSHSQAVGSSAAPFAESSSVSSEEDMPDSLRQLTVSLPNFPLNPLPGSEDDHDAHIAAAVEALVGRRNAPNSSGSTGLDLPSTDEVLQSIMMLSGNDRCAECGQENPRWSSWNLGILICLECSGWSLRYAMQTFHKC